jgi:hypothetical protein
MGKSLTFEKNRLEELKEWGWKETEREIYGKLHPIRVKRKLILPTDEELEKSIKEWHKEHPTYKEDLQRYFDQFEGDDLYDDYIPKLLVK